MKPYCKIVREYFVSRGWRLQKLFPTDWDIIYQYKIFDGSGIRIGSFVKRRDNGVPKEFRDRIEEPMLFLYSYSTRKNVYVRLPVSECELYKILKYIFEETIIEFRNIEGKIWVAERVV